MKIEINHFLPETGTDDEKWTLTFHDGEPAHGHPFIYHAPISQEVYKAIKHLQSQNKELISCLENSTKIMEEQEGEVMDLIVCDTMNHQIRWNKETLKTKKP